MIRMAACDESAKVECAQCGVVAYPHSICRCRMCGAKHPKSRVCATVSALRQAALPFTKSEFASNAINADFPSLQFAISCDECHRVLARQSRCLQQPDANSSEVYELCRQCGLRVSPHSRCRCLQCGGLHLHTSPCRVMRASKTYAAINGAIPVVHDAGSMDQICPFCCSRSWRSETISCCASGAIVLPSFPPVPEALSSVILSPHVRDNIRAYNMVMAMASVGHKNRSLPDGMFKLGGRTFHRIGSMTPTENASHAFAQIYVLDAEQASDRRLNLMNGHDGLSPLRRDVLTQLHSLLLQHNPCVQQFVAAARDNLPKLVWRCSDDIASMQMGALVVQSGSKRDIVIQYQV